MRKVLYLISDATGPLDLLPQSESSIDPSVVLIEDAVTRQDIPTANVRALIDDNISRGGVKYPTMTTSELVRAIFESDSVVSL
jgi:hypothetical protein